MSVLQGMLLLQFVACFHSPAPYRQVNGVPAVQGSPEAGKKRMGLLAACFSLGDNEG